MVRMDGRVHIRDCLARKRLKSSFETHMVSGEAEESSASKGYMEILEKKLLCS